MLNKILLKIFHPLVFSLFPALSLYSTNINELKFGEIWLPIILSASLVAFCWGFFNLFLKNLQKSAILASVFFLLFASYSHIVGGIILKFAPNIPNRYFLLVLILVTILGGLLLQRLKKSFDGVTIILNILSISLLITPLVTTGWMEVNRAKYNIKITPLLNNTIIDSQITSNSPDIYYIIVDRYPAFRTTQQNYSFDNSLFMQMLEDRGFVVVLGSRANYPFTTTSLASSLNMRFLDEVISEIGAKSIDSTPFYDLIENNEVVNYLKSKGYRYLHFGPDYGPAAYNKNAEYNYSYWHDPLNLSEFPRRFIDQTAFNPLASFVTRIIQGDRNLAEDDRFRSFNLALDQLREVASTTKVPGPKFVFVHTFLTHEPYVFDSNGNYLTKEKVDKKDNKKLFIDQVVSANKHLIELIKTLQDNSETQPIIVIQSDEGPYPERYNGNLLGFNWKKATDDEISEKFRIINAYYLPGLKKEDLQLSKTPVNTFRTIFNLYFGENLPLLEDRSFAQVGAGRPYEFFEITKKLR